MSREIFDSNVTVGFELDSTTEADGSKSPQAISPEGIRAIMGDSVIVNMESDLTIPENINLGSE
jgi:hypothetical protein